MNHHIRTGKNGGMEVYAQPGFRRRLQPAFAGRAGVGDDAFVLLQIMAPNAFEHEQVGYVHGEMHACEVENRAAAVVGRAKPS